MHFASRFSTLLLSLLLPFVSSATAQQSDPSQETASSQPPGKIYLDVVVTQKAGGAPVSGLTQQDFKIFDNKAPQTMTSFESLGGNQAPVQVLLVLDAVNATFSTVATERDQIEKFLRAHGEHLAHPTSVALVTDTGIQMDPTASTDGNKVSATLDAYAVRLRTLRRSSGFYGANDRLNISLNALGQLSTQEAAKPGRKLILWVSPGWPLLSGPNVELGRKQHQQIFSSIVQLSTQLRQARVTLYALDALGASEPVLRSSYYENFVKGITKPWDATLGNLGLQVIATQTGGQVVLSNDLGLLLERCLADTTAYYELSYDPPPAEHRDEYHSIEVRVPTPGLTARTLQGYYSQP